MSTNYGPLQQNMTYDNEGNLVPLENFSIGENYLNTSTMENMDIDPFELASARTYGSTGLGTPNFSVGDTAGSTFMPEIDPPDGSGPVSTPGFMLGGFIPNFITKTSESVDELKSKFPRLNNLFSLSGNNKMLMDMISNVGSAEFDDKGEMTNPGTGLFGREGGFLSKFGTGQGALSGMSGLLGIGGALGEGLSNIGKDLEDGGYQYANPFERR